MRSCRRLFDRRLADWGFDTYIVGRIIQLPYDWIADESLKIIQVNKVQV